MVGVAFGLSTLVRVAMDRPPRWALQTLLCGMAVGGICSPIQNSNCLHVHLNRLELPLWVLHSQLHHDLERAPKHQREMRYFVAELVTVEVHVGLQCWVTSSLSVQATFHLHCFTATLHSSRITSSQHAPLLETAKGVLAHQTPSLGPPTRGSAWVGRRRSRHEMASISSMQTQLETSCCTSLQYTKNHGARRDVSMPLACGRSRPRDRPKLDCSAAHPEPPPSG